MKIEKTSIAVIDYDWMGQERIIGDQYRHVSLANPPWETPTPAPVQPRCVGCGVPITTSADTSKVCRACLHGDHCQCQRCIQRRKDVAAREALK